MSNWKYTDATNKVVYKINANGSGESCLVSAIEDQLVAGNEPEPADIPPAPVITVTPWQIRKALNQLGLRAAVEAAVIASTDQELKDGWEFSSEVTRNSPLVLTMATALNKTDAELDNLFSLAQTL